VPEKLVRADGEIGVGEHFQKNYEMAMILKGKQAVKN